MSTSANLAVVVDPDAPGRLVIRSVPEPVPGRGEAIVRVRALSLNRGEVRRSGMATAGWRPGWDLAGVVERAAADGGGPSVGARVVGFLPEGAWAQRVAVPKNALAELPDKVTFSQAATFPVAGLTALLALGKGGPLLGKRVLVTGATGGVGDFAVQLARLAGARVTALARRGDQAPALHQLGAHEVTVGDEIPPAPKYDVILDSVGGRTLGTALAALAPGGICVTFGVSAGAEVTFDARAFFIGGRATLYVYYLFQELGLEPAAVGLQRLADLVAGGQLTPHISVERPWKDIGQVAEDLMARRFPGKAVLAVD
jgi:NADPH:quinone reductase-like Zn-dependent oxidoreductase